MNFLEIIKSIHEIKKGKKSPGELYIGLATDEISEYLQQIFDVSISSLYHKIFPLCRLAHLFEQNGVPEDHALKLSHIFKDEIAVYRYLIKFAAMNQTEALVHDACLFELPDVNDDSFLHWKKLANERDNMLHASFKKMLPHAKEIKMVLNSGARIKDDFKSILTTEKKLKTVMVEYRKKNRKKSDLKFSSLQKHELSLELGYLCIGLNFRKLTVLRLQALYELYKTHYAGGHKKLINLGLNERSIALFYTLKPVNDDGAIPNVFIDGRDIGYDGIYLKKLDVLTVEGAALAACLGLLTNCCQYLGGSGADCTIHGITSVNGGFYVLHLGDADKPQADDPVLAQSWVWKSKNGALCFDSIEVTAKDRIAVAGDMFRYLGFILCRDFVPYIHTGSQSGITSKVALKRYPVQPEYPLDYTGYRDSKVQRLLAHKDMPYLFYEEVNSKVFKNLIMQKTRDFFRDIFHNTLALKESEPLKQAICYSLYFKEPDLLNIFFEENAWDRKQEFENLWNVNEQYLKNLNKNQVDIDDFTRGAWLHGKNNKDYNALQVMVLAGNFNKILPLIAAGLDPDIQDKNGDTPLMLMLKNFMMGPKQKKLLAEALIKGGADPDIRNIVGATAAMAAAHNHEIRNLLLDNSHKKLEFQKAPRFFNTDCSTVSAKSTELQPALSYT